MTGDGSTGGRSDSGGGGGGGPCRGHPEVINLLKTIRFVHQQI